MKIKIKKLHPDAVIPKYAHNTDAGLDLTAVSAKYINENKIEYSTGIAVEIPDGYVGLVFPRSSIHKTSSLLSNSVGVIDSGYRGEIKAVFYVDEHSDCYRVGDRICQLIIIPYPKIEFEDVEELSDSDRGNGGFGSTGR